MPNGLVKEVKGGLRGLRGLSSGGSLGVMNGFTVMCQSYILYLSSGTVRKRRIPPQGSFGVSPPVLLDRRFRDFSEGVSGFISSIRVGSEGLCFRCCTARISHDLKADTGCCATNSQSPWRSQYCPTRLGVSTVPSSYRWIFASSCSLVPVGIYRPDSASKKVPSDLCAQQHLVHNSLPVPTEDRSVVSE